VCEGVGKLITHMCREIEGQQIQPVSNRP